MGVMQVELVRALVRSAVSELRWVWLAPRWVQRLFAVKLQDQRPRCERGTRASPERKKQGAGTEANAWQQSRGLQYSAVAERESAFSRVGITPSYGFR